MLGVAAYTNCLLSPKRQTCTQNYANLSLSLYETIRISLFLPPPSFLLPKTTATSTHQKTLAIDPTNLSLLFLTHPPLHRQEPPPKNSSTHVEDFNLGMRFVYLISLQKSK